jgi:adenine/guanine phosphoribosyltransferase-like PRPP-binding protein
MSIERPKEQLGLWIESQLRKRFLNEAKVTNFEKGYISVPSVNQRIDLEMQGWAADLIVDHFRKLGIEFDAVVGIPNSGIPLGTSVAERLGVPLAPGRKGKDFPGAWKMPVIVEENVPSFTTGVTSSFVFNGIQSGETVLAVEDVIATGETMENIARAFQAKGITVYNAAYFAKVFQGGVARLREIGIEPFYAIGIEKITGQEGDYSLELSSPYHP